MKHARIALVVLVSLVFMIGYCQGKADASDYQPYGGCKEAINYPRSEGADICRQHGWTITRHIIVRPDKVAVSWWRLPTCQRAVLGPCHAEDWSYWLNHRNIKHPLKGVGT